MSINKFLKKQLVAIGLIVLIVPAGIATKFYSGPGSKWVNNSLGGVFYEIFWCLIIFILFHRLKPVAIALAVFMATCALEFLQLWHPAFLELIRNNFIGRTILGTSFAWYDFIYYIIGSLAGYFILKWLNKK